MADQPRYEISHSLGSGFDFYTGDERLVASASLTAESNLAAIITQEHFTSSSISASADAQIIGRRIVFASSAISVDGAVVIVTVERQDALITISGSVNVQTLIEKYAFSAASLTVSADLVANATKQINIASSLESSSNVAIEAIEILLAVLSASGSVNTSTSAVKIAFAEANLAIEGFTLVIARERQDALISINIQSNVNTIITKYAFAASSIAIDSLIQVDGTKVIPISAALSANSSLSATASEFVLAAANISGSVNLEATSVIVHYGAASLSGTVDMSVLGKIVLATIRITAIQDLNVTAKAIKFSSVTGVDTTSLRTILLLDGKPLTNQNRSLQISSVPIFIENNNWDGTSSRYYKNQSNGDRKTFSLSWSFIPNFRENTVDLNHSRDFIRKAALDPDVHILKIINQDASGLTSYTETTYNVFVKDFSENLVRRDLVDNVYYWDCSVMLEEV